ncbi:hypothetical protein jhhlp_001129 [Lomentospora prolificans]|uniref:Dipeptidylpeptidase IV N-terminal domain-containing protein n=1 Tax=Lomentospora prolificans TaxID=41688 RepID=A0A2N3NHB8_9PEZI|nr:hypothetical protein jhhlp_001129 [Lomentospora prolificans]
MTIRATKFTPEVLLSAPRRGQGLPNPAGTTVLYTSSTYSFESHSKADQIRLLNVETGETTVISESSSLKDPTWIGDTEVLLLDHSGNGDSTTSIVYLDVTKGR